MTPEQMRIAAAESLGWKWFYNKTTKTYTLRMVALWYEQQESGPPPQNAKEVYLTCPKYDTSLDAVAELEKTLSEKERIEYLMRLSQPTKSAMPLDPNYAEEQWLLVTKPPIARLEAYVRAKGLWKKENERLYEPTI